MSAIDRFDCTNKQLIKQSALFYKLFVSTVKPVLADTCYVLRKDVGSNIELQNDGGFHVTTETKHTITFDRLSYVS